jgi:isopentenyldiphosphate isomerase
VHRDGDWHAALHVWVGGIGPDGEPFVLFQRRSATKDTFPGALDVAVGGHFRAGESLADTLREAEEEIGLALAPGELVRIGRRFTRALGGRDCEVQEVYAARSDLPLYAYRPHEEEVAGLATVSIAGAEQVFSGAVEAVEIAELPRGAAEPVRSPLIVSGFAGLDRDRYAVAALARLGLVIRGKPVTPFELRD